jgi:hypothetical protein
MSDNIIKTGKALCEEFGKILAESFINAGKEKILKESFGISKSFKEASGQSTANNTGAYVSLLGKTLYDAALEKSQKILDLVDINEDLIRAGNHGFGSMTLPRLTPTIAYEVSEGAIINDFDEGIDPIVVVCRKIVAKTTITWEMNKRGMNDYTKYVIRNGITAIERKLCGDIVNGLAAGTGLAATTGGIDYEAVRDAETLVNNAEHSNGVKYGFIADALVISSANFGTFMKDTNVKNFLMPVNAQNGMTPNIGAMPLAFGNLEIISTPYLTSCQALVLEKKRNILVKESELELYDGRVSGSIDDEIIAVMSYVLAMIFPDSVATITA